MSLHFFPEESDLYPLLGERQKEKLVMDSCYNNNLYIINKHNCNCWKFPLGKEE